MSDNPIEKSKLSLQALLDSYNKINASLTQQLSDVAAQVSETSPGQFLLLQMKTSQLAQIGESISNIIAQANAIIKNTIQNQRAS
ncbi:MAG: hypothetical protein K940chlam8_00154 [Chlamydiae bacterium]|nr:hypothetical protein [Chlamydiota bacterium]